MLHYVLEFLEVSICKVTALRSYFQICKLVCLADEMLNSITSILIISASMVFQGFI